MHSSGSVLKTILERARTLLDEATVDAKFSDDYLVRHNISQALADVISRLNMNSDNKVVVRHAFSLVEDQQYYQLPPCVGTVIRIVAVEEETGVVEWDSRPRGEFHPDGPGWSLEGNTLSVRPYPRQADTIELWYNPSGDFTPHYGTTGASSSDGLTFTLASSSSLGHKDKRLNAYAGSVLRVLGANVHEERVINSHDPSAATNAGTLTLRSPLITNVNASNLTYEIVSPGSQSMMSCLAHHVAMTMAGARGVSQARYAMYLDGYRHAIKSLRDNLSNMQGRTGKHIEKMTVDNDDYWVL